MVCTYDNYEQEKYEWEELNEALELYGKVRDKDIEQPTMDEVIINYESDTIWGLNLSNVKGNNNDKKILVCKTSVIFNFADLLRATANSLFFEDYEWNNMNDEVYESLVLYGQQNLPRIIKKSEEPISFSTINKSFLKAALMCEIQRGDILKKLEYQKGDTREVIELGSSSLDVTDIVELVKEQHHYPIKFTLQHMVTSIQSSNQESLFINKDIVLDGSDLLQNVQWSTLVDGLGKFLQLKTLNLSNNNIGRDGCSALANLLENDNSPLESLLLDRNQVDDECISILCNGLRNNKTLTKLALHRNDRITQDGYGYLSDLVCNKTDVNSTYYQSNHVLQSIGIEENGVRGENGSVLFFANDSLEAIMYLGTLLKLNKRTNECSAHVVARQKVWHVHFKNRDFDFRPFLNMDVELMPHALSWFASSQESDKAYRRQSLLYHFIRNHWDIPVLFGFSWGSIGE